MSRLLLISLVLVAAIFTFSEARRRKTPSCDNSMPGNTERTCNKNLVNGRFPKNTVCTWSCLHGCVRSAKKGGARTRTCKGRPGVWKKLAGKKYQKAKGLQCNCASCTNDFGGFPVVPGIAAHDCENTGQTTFPFGSHCVFSCDPGFALGDDPEMLCLNGRWVAENAVPCTDIDECAENTHNCHADATCTNTVGSFTCECNEGFEGDGVTCTESDVDECAAGTDNCHAEATCTNTDGSFTCECNEGFEGDGVTCTDIDECATNDGGCAHSCENTDGSFKCSCPYGFILSDDNLGCEPEPTGEMPTVMPTGEPPV
ncbi:uncharacterized protein LOC144866701 [Branchiostoma floridae x Branchiostoma japonicum]